MKLLRPLVLLSICSVIVSSDLMAQSMLRVGSLNGALKVSYDISKQMNPGQKIEIAVRVYDWYGAGGIFRPVRLSTAARSDVQVLK